MKLAAKTRHTRLGNTEVHFQLFDDYRNYVARFGEVADLLVTFVGDALDRARVAA